MTNDVKVVFMGTPEFAVPTLEALVAQGWDVLVVTQPDKKVGRHRTVTPPPVKVAAEKLGLPVLQPVKVREADVVRELEEFAPDLLVTAAYGQLLPNSVLSIPRVGALNVHASLLPRWRGAAPIQRSIMAGDAQTGVTLMEMVLALDAGPMVASKAVDILEDDTFGSLHDKLSQIGAEICTEVLPKYLRGEAQAIPQPEDTVTYAAKIERHDEFVDWTASVREVDRQLRGLNPWPGTSAFDGEQTIKLWSGVRAELELALRPGEVKKHHKGVFVGCMDGALQLLEVQPAGRRRMAATDWFSGLRKDTLSFVEGAAQ